MDETDRPSRVRRALSRVRRALSIHRLDRDTAIKTIVVMFALVLAIVIWVVASYVSVTDRLQAQQNSTRRLAVSTQKLLDARHADRLNDQAAQLRRDATLDRKIRDIICAAISADPQTRKRLLPLLPAPYAKQKCRPVQQSQTVPPSPSSTSTAVQPSSSRPSKAPRPPATSSPTPGRPQPSSTPQPVTSQRAQPGILAPVASAACQVLSALGLCSP